MSGQRISANLVVAGGQIRCVGCDHALAPSATSWKRHAAVTTVALAMLPGAASAVEPRVVLRRFACPRCGRLLDTETALPDDPFLDDIVRV